jgi:hypothetical protein
MAAPAPTGTAGRHATLVGRNLCAIASANPLNDLNQTGPAGDPKVHRRTVVFPWWKWLPSQDSNLE